MRPVTIEETQEVVRASSHLLPRGAGTKPALSTPSTGVDPLDMSGVCGVTGYEPGEFTFTALAGTPVREVNDLLERHGQYLPFDPPLAGRGATLGGTVASGLSGPGRYHYGGVCDFLLGVHFVDSAGQVIQSGGKVVKNAAGFDLSKLMVGSLGQFGVLAELTFKVFPRPEASLTLRLEFKTLEDSLQILKRLNASQLDIDSLDLEPTRPGAVLWVRLRGLGKALPARLDRLRALAGDGEILDGQEEASFWQDARELNWVPPGWSLVKVPLTPGRVPALERELAEREVMRRYSAGGQVGWLALQAAGQSLEGFLLAQNLSGLVLFGPPGPPRLGMRSGDSFARRVKAALDRDKRFVEV